MKGDTICQKRMLGSSDVSRRGLRCGNATHYVVGAHPSSRWEGGGLVRGREMGLMGYVFTTSTPGVPLFSSVKCPKGDRGMRGIRDEFQQGLVD